MDGWMRLAGQAVLRGKTVTKDGVFTVKGMVGTDSFYGATDGVYGGFHRDGDRLVLGIPQGGCCCGNRGSRFGVTRAEY